MPRGKAPRAGVRSTRKVEFRCTEEELRELRRRAAENGVTVSEWCRLAAALLTDELDPPDFQVWQVLDEASRPRPL